MYRPELYDTERYTLFNTVFGEIDIEEPSGWDSDLLEIKKSKKNFSTLTKYSTNLEFNLSGAEFLAKVYNKLGFDADIILTKYGMHETEVKEDTLYRALLDGYSYEPKELKATINTMESELSSFISTYGGEDIEVSRLKSLNNVDLPEIVIKNVFIDSKNLLLVTKWRFDDEPENPWYLNHIGYTMDFKAIPLNNYANSDDQAYSVLDGGTIQLIPTTFSQDDCLYSIALDDITAELSIDIDMDFTNGALIKNSYVRLIMVLLEDNSATGGTQHDFLDSETIAVSTKVNASTANLTYKWKGEKALLKGQSLSLTVFTYAENKTENAIPIFNECDISWAEQRYEVPFNTKAILPFDLLNRLLQIMTGRTDTVLLSNHFGRVDLGYDVDGDGSYLGISSGFWARNFYDKDIVTSWDDAIKSYNAVETISFSIEKVGTTEYVRAEPLSYFFNNNIFVLDQVVVKPEFNVAKDFSYSSINIGYDIELEYDEAVGLDEFNGKHNYTTPISKNKTELELLSKYRGDMMGFIFAGRKPQKDWPTTDTRYDEDIFFLDLKKVSGSTVLLQRKINDDFLGADVFGIYSPWTSTNLRISPKRLLLRHGWFIHNCLSKYGDKYIQFVSATGNSEMILDGLEERGNYLVNLLDKQKFLNIDVSLDYDTDNALSDQLLENINGIFEFVSDNGETYQFRLFEFSKNKYKGLLVNGYIQ